MKSKGGSKLVTRIGTGGLLAVTLLVGYVLGRGDLPNQTQTVKADTRVIETTPRQAGSGVTKIAVVNADHGIQVDGETINYATRLTQRMGEKFVFENLEAARAGIENGAYAAYIVIPATFSKSVISLNATPSPAKLEYAMSQELQKEKAMETLYNINAFENELNSSMSYMYVSAILKEFHGVQDDAKIIRNNDQRNTQVLLDVQPENLVEMVPIPQYTRADNSVEPVDLSQYNEKNAQAVADIDSDYAAYIAMSQSDLVALQEDGDQLITQFSAMQKTLEDLEQSSKDAQQSVNANGVAGIENWLRDYNADTLGGKEDELKTYLSGIHDDLAQMKLDLETARINYNAAPLDQETLVSFRDELLAGVDVPISYDPHDDQMIIGNPGEEIICPLVYSTDGEIDLDQLAVAMQDAFRTSADLQLPRGQDMEDLIHTTVLDFVDYAAYTEEDGTIVDTTVTELLNRSITELGDTDALDQLAAIEPVPVSDVKSQVDANIIAPLTQQVQSTTDQLAATYADEKTALASYGSTLKGYNPLGYIDQSTIQGHLSKMSENNGQMQTTVSDNYTANMNYVGEVYKNTDEHIAALETHIKESQEASEEKVRTGLESAQASVSSVSETNQLLLKEFTEKLPYTRLGAVENQTAYQFITDPVLLLRSDTDRDVPENTPEVLKRSIVSDLETDPEIQDEKGTNQFYQYGFYSLIIILAAAGLFKAVAKHTHRDDRRDIIS